jgi:hypothetical protein
MAITTMLMAATLCHALPVKSFTDGEIKSTSPPPSREKGVMLFGSRTDQAPPPKRTKLNQSTSQDEAKGASVSSPQKHQITPEMHHYQVTDAILGLPITYDASKHPIHPIIHHPDILESTLKRISKDTSTYTNANRFKHLTNAKVFGRGHEMISKPHHGILDEHRQLIYHHQDILPEDAFQKAHDGRYHVMRESHGYYRIADPPRHRSTSSFKEVISTLAGHTVNQGH